ncbi:MAG TPA: sigma-70 family RNA polymerase sigma factor [Polyangiales bacterium]|nr:sigma-70 family RNA polymerase sigma factor [Polyangiales bacterium]
MTLARHDLDALYRTHAGNAFRRARRLLNDEAEAHEVVHDLFVSLYERPDQHAGRSSMSTFLYGAITHACLNRIRYRKNRERLLERHAGSVPVPAAAVAADDAAQLRMLLERIPEPLAHVAVYAFMDGLTHEEIARVMGCSRRQVGNLLERLARWTQQEQAECG